MYRLMGTSRQTGSSSIYVYYNKIKFLEGSQYSFFWYSGNLLFKTILFG